MVLDGLKVVEIYIPTYFNPPGAAGVVGDVREVDAALVDEFINDTLTKYQGVTQSNPATVTPFRGLWRQGEWSTLYVDHLTVVFCLVQQHDLAQAIEHFNEWKERLKRELHQEEVLVLIQSLHTISDF